MTYHFTNSHDFFREALGLALGLRFEDLLGRYLAASMVEEGPKCGPLFLANPVSRKPDSGKMRVRL
jgi:hypothetical protein